MALETTFVPLPLEQLHREAAIKKIEGWRFIQTHAVNTDDGVDLYYSFMKDGTVVNYRVEGVKKDQPVPSITDLFLAAFVFENEARELFGVDMRDIAIDFAGAMYAPAETEPMTYMSPEQKAAIDKARKAAAAKNKKEAAQTDGESGAQAPAKRAFVMTPEMRARYEAKKPTMSPEKIAKVEAAIKAREAEAAAAGADVPETASAAPKDEPVAKPAAAVQAEAPTASKDALLEQKLAAMDPAKAAKVRAALEGKAAASPADAVESGAKVSDPKLENLINQMDDAKAAKVREALRLKGGE